MLRVRTLSALVLVPVVAFFVYLGGWPFLAFVIALAMLGVYEIAGMLRSASLAPNWPALAGFAVWPVLAAFWPAWHIELWAPIAILLASLVGSVFSSESPQRGVPGWGLSLAGGMYLGWPLSYFILLRQVPGPSALQGWEAGVLWLALALGCTWATDTGAYLIGRQWGRHQLYPRLSPAKTWEGAIGGVACAVLVALWVGPWTGLSWGASVLAGLLLASVAILGDLVESWLKRGLGVKDASGLIPGHGGVLDRLDSLLFSVVVVYGLGPGGRLLL